MDERELDLDPVPKFDLVSVVLAGFFTGIMLGVILTAAVGMYVTTK